MEKIQALTIKEHKKAHSLTQYANTHQENEIQKLNNFLMKNYSGQLDGTKTPVDVAIEIMRGNEQ